MITIVILLLAVVSLELYRLHASPACSLQCRPPANRCTLPSRLIRSLLIADAVRPQGIWLYGLNPVQRWRYRHIPGPRPAWLLGNAVTMRRKMAHIAYEDWKALYGPVFRIFIGMQPFVVITGAAGGQYALRRPDQTSPPCGRRSYEQFICHNRRGRKLPSMQSKQ